MITRFLEAYAAWNEVESGKTGGHSQPSIYLTEPQGKFKKWYGLLRKKRYITTS